MSRVSSVEQRRRLLVATKIVKKADAAGRPALDASRNRDPHARRVTDAGIDALQRRQERAVLADRDGRHAAG